MIWLWFACIQLISLLATVVGWLLLWPFCQARAWKRGPLSVKDQRTIDEWSWKPLNYIYGNPEDGVSGQTALVWVNGKQVSYKPTSSPAWRAYCWSALRNSCDALKYAFARPGVGPLITFGRHKAGWQLENGVNVPVLS